MVWQPRFYANRRSNRRSTFNYGRGTAWEAVCPNSSPEEVGTEELTGVGETSTLQRTMTPTMAATSAANPLARCPSDSHKPVMSVVHAERACQRQRFRPRPPSV